MRAIVMALAALSACSPPAAPQAAPEPIPVPASQARANAQDLCGADAYRASIGQPVADLDLPDTVRIIRPNVPVTDDLRADRLNIIVDADGRIIRLECY